MSNQIIEYQGERVLLTNQLADAYGTDNKNINDNFQNNMHRYVQGKHYFVVEGDELREFKATTIISGNLKYAPILYLWTKKGSWMHAKSLNTDEAWEAYEALVDDYYEKTDRPQINSVNVSMLSTEMQMFKQLWDGIALTQIEHAETKRMLETTTKEVKEVKDTLDVIQDTIVTRNDDWRKSMNSMLNSAAYRSGKKYSDVRSESYASLEQRAHCDLNKRLRNMKSRLTESGATKTKVEGLTRMDVIESDSKLKEIYTAIVKEFSISSLRVAK